MVKSRLESYEPTKSEKEERARISPDSDLAKALGEEADAAYPAGRRRLETVK